MKPLRRNDLAENPVTQFRSWFTEAQGSPEIIYPTACCLATVDPDGFPNGRMVLLKDFTEEGFTFYTNRNSLKGTSLLRTPKASLTFYWPTLFKQIRVQGATEAVSDEEADEYFRTRPRDSQLGAWASSQSEVASSRSEIDARVEQATADYDGREIPRPPHWGGFRIRPRRFEFWQERPARLHDRFRYERDAHGVWRISRLYP